MKRLVCAALAAVFMLVCAACGSTAPGGLDMAPAELIGQVCQGVELPEVGELELTQEDFEYFAFVPYIEGAEAVASEALISAIPHSVVAIRLPEGEDASAVAAEIEAAADPAKWICVTAEQVEVKHSGRMVLLVMSSQGAAGQIAANFDSLAGK